MCGKVCCQEVGREAFEKKIPTNKKRIIYKGTSLLLDIISPACDAWEYGSLFESMSGIGQKTGRHTENDKVVLFCLFLNLLRYNLKTAKLRVQKPMGLDKCV